MGFLIIFCLNFCSISVRWFAGSNKRFVKFLLLLSGYNLFNFEGGYEAPLQKLHEINSRLSAFNSAQKDAISKTFARFEPSDQISDIIEDYRLLAIFSRGIQKKETTEERIKLLHKILERELEYDRLTK